MPIRRIALTVAAVATLLLGLQKGGVIWSEPVGDLQFDWTAHTAPEEQSITMRARTEGYFRAWIEVWVPHDPGDAGTYSASVAGQPLAVTTLVARPGTLNLAISDPPAPPLGDSFLWPEGQQVTLTHTGMLHQPFVLTDWVVHPVSSANDSASDAWWRKISRGISWLLIVLAVAGVAVGVWSGEREPAATPMRLVRHLMADAGGRQAVERALSGEAGALEALDSQIRHVPATSAAYRAAELRTFGVVGSLLLGIGLFLPVLVGRWDGLSLVLFNTGAAAAVAIHAVSSLVLSLRRKFAFLWATGSASVAVLVLCVLQYRDFVDSARQGHHWNRNYWYFVGQYIGGHPGPGSFVLPAGVILILVAAYRSSRGHSCPHCGAHLGRGSARCAQCDQDIATGSTATRKPSHAWVMATTITLVVVSLLVAWVFWNIWKNTQPNFSI